MLRPASLLLLAAGAAAPAGAQAQQASYCNAQVAADAIYSTVTSNGRTATLSYFVRLENRTNRTIPALSVTFGYPLARDRIDGPPPGPPGLQPYERVTVMLGRQTVDNASGLGGLRTYEVDNGVPLATTVICPGF